MGVLGRQVAVAVVALHGRVAAQGAHLRDDLLHGLRLPQVGPGLPRPEASRRAAEATTAAPWEVSDQSLRDMPSMV